MTTEPASWAYVASWLLVFGGIIAALLVAGRHP